MKCFDILEISDFSNKEKVEKAYNAKIEQLTADKELFSSELYEKKFNELDQAKSDCLDYIDKSFSEKIVAQSKNEISMRNNKSVLYSDSLCCLCMKCNLIQGALIGAGFLVVLSFIVNVIKEICDWYNSTENKEKRLARKEAKYRRIVEEQNRKKLEKEKAEREKLIKQKTKELQKETKYINKDISRYNELCKKSSCTDEKIKHDLKLIELFSIIDSKYEKSFDKAIEPYKKIALEKSAIEEKVKKTAQLYRDIRNYPAANELIGRLNK